MVKSESRRLRMSRIQDACRSDPDLLGRVSAILRFASRIRVSEYHVTNACNIRCEGCWFFAYGHDQSSRDNRDPARLEEFLDRERARKINTALVIGGEPTLVPERLAVFRDKMRYLTISTNGLKRLSREGFEDVAVGITLFGGGALDDRLRGIRPNGKRFRGLFAQALRNYEGDPRAGFVYAITEDGIGHIEETVRQARDHGIRVTFNYYSRYGDEDPAALRDREALLDEALRVQAEYPGDVMSHPYYIRAMITGRSHWADFGYEVCPSLSVDHPAHEERRRNGHPVLPLFNTWAADLETVKLCCTSGECHGCRDSQAVHSWLLVSVDRFLDSPDDLATWVEIAESYWSQFVWSPFHPSRRPVALQGAAL